jgi:hypothetical protein
MFRKSFLVALLPLLFLLTACPYKSTVPLGEPTGKVSPKFFGTWTEKADKNPTFYVVTDAGMQYNIEKNEYDEVDNAYQKENFMGYFTQVGNETFLNLKLEDKKDKAKDKYAFYKVVLTEDGKSFELFEVTVHIKETFDNIAKLKAFFEKYKELSYFYQTDGLKHYKK